jgi:PhzF family phenazine biosynthesis protein
MEILKLAQTTHTHIFIVAAFAEVPFRGNPVGVCIPAREMTTAELHLIARELKQPETAFIWDNGGHWAIRWFSPDVEVDMCGHATLAAAHVLWSEGIAPRRNCTFGHRKLSNRLKKLRAHRRC